MDPNIIGQLVQNGPNGSGGVATSNGGYWLITGAATSPQQTLNTYGAGLGPSGGAAPTVAGTFQQGSNSQSGSAFCLDLMDVQAGSITGWLNSPVSQVTPPPIIAGDGSGEAVVMQGFWASVYTANGAQVASVPAPTTSWSTATTGLLNATIRNSLRLLNMPPAARMSSTGTQTLTNGTTSQVTLNTQSLDNYGGFATAGGGVYTVQLPGLYLVHGLVSWNGGITGEVGTAVVVNGLNLYGPASPLSNTGRVSTAKTQIFDLKAGDTISLAGIVNANGNGGIGGSGASRLMVLWLGATGVPAVPATKAPDITSRFTAGTSGAAAATQLNQLGVNLNFLLQRPYATVYSTANQTGITVNNRTGLTCYNNVNGLINGSNGDNYSGWDATNQRYQAPIDGWYMAVSETFVTPPGAGTFPAVASLFQASVQGAATWDFKQQQNFNFGGTNAGGSSGIGLYYLRAGDWLRTGVLYNDSSGTSYGTFNGSGRRPHFEIVWISE